jgi:hypothetical protein
MKISSWLMPLLVASLLSGFVLALLIAGKPAPADAAGYTGTQLYTSQTTLGSGATALAATSLGVYQLQIQNNAAHNMRCGDSNVSSTRGALLLANGVGSDNFGPASFQMFDLSQIYCAGTSGDVVDVIYLH